MGPAGRQGQLVLDQISGFRARFPGDVSYYGPIGVSVQRWSETSPANLDTSFRRTTLWIAPQADLFVIDQLSIGLQLELSRTSTTVDRDLNPNTRQSLDLPGTTTFTLLPRVGYLFPLGERFAIWPRLGLGYTSHQINANDTSDADDNRITRSGLLLQLDVGFLYRFTDAIFLRFGPDLATTLGGTRTFRAGGTELSTDANVFAFSITTGFGVMFDVF